MKDNEQYNYSYQPPIDYAPYGYYSNPPDVKFFQPMELSLGP
jgi:hypothetical protein